MKYDGIGYVNGRGKSKYWGVTTGIDGSGRDFWIVSFTPVERVETFTLHSENFKLGELDAAKIAAYIVENGRSMVNLQDAKILSHDKRFVLFIKHTSIYRERFVNQITYKNKTEVNLFDAVLPTKPAGTPEVLTALRQFPTQLETKAVVVEAKPVDTESSDIATLAQMILDCNLSARASRVLIAVLQSNIA
jgi:hypothetical protein